MILFAADMDNTLIYSYKKITGDAICVETKEGKNLSYMTKNAYELLQKAAEKTLFVPVTTRSIEQYQRINLFNGKQPVYALCSNGGILLKKGQIDIEWLLETKRLIRDTQKDLETGQLVLGKDKNIIFDIRLVDGIFVYTKSKEPEKTILKLKENLNEKKVYIDCNGEKIYIFPKILDKGFAVERLKKMTKVNKIIAAGDSAFDIPMLRVADIGWIPKKEELISVFAQRSFIIPSQKEGIYFGDFLLEQILDFVDKTENNINQ